MYIPEVEALTLLPVTVAPGAVNVVELVTSPRLFPWVSNACTVKLCELPTVMVAVLGEIVTWSSWAEFAVTVRDAVSDRLPCVAVMVHVPAFSEVYIAPVHEPPA